MARGTWTIYSKETGSWVLDGTIYRPNEDVVLSINTTMTVVSLVDGDEAYILPTTKYIKQPINFKWDFVSVSFFNQLQTYIENATPLKIVDHNGINYVGRFMSFDPNWLSGEVGDDGLDVYDISASFKIMPSLT